MQTIYFDYNATTPLDGSVREAMIPFLKGDFGNPSSIHHLGRKARVALDEARETMARTLGCKPSEIVFTSGGTESNNLAILGAARAMKPGGRHLITSTVEHHAVLNPCEYLQKHEGFEVTLLPVDSHGLINPADLRKAIRPDTTLVSLMAANNETGSIQPVAELGAVCRSAGVLFHTDAVQWFGKEPFTGIDSFQADFVSLCSHKFHGPKGAGSLYIRSPLQPHSLLFGGSHENERRAGTENLPGIIGLAKATELFVRRPVFPELELRKMTANIVSSLESVVGVNLQGIRSPRLSNTCSFTAAGCDSISLLAALDLEGICASSGSACSSGSLTPSHVLTAMGVPMSLANSFVRFSLGRENTVEEVERLLQIFPAVVGRIRNSG